MKTLPALSLFVLLALAWPSFGLAQTLSFSAFTPDPRHLDVESGSAQSIAGLGEVIKTTLGSAFPSTYRPDSGRFYVVVHVLRWTDPVTSLRAKAGDPDPAPQQQVQRSRWYVYSNDGAWTLDDFQKNNRVFGVAQLWLAAVHLNLYVADDDDKADRLRTYRANYTVKAVGKQPMPLQHFAQLASLFPGLPALGGVGAAAVSVAPSNRIALWGATQVAVANPSDITITPFLETDDAGKNNVPLGDETKFDNEGRYSLDFGIAVPIRAATQLKSGEAGGSAVPKVISKSNAFATVDWYFKPIDVKAGGLRRVPHAVAGFSITSKPQENFFLGLGWGPAIANFFGAYQWTKLEEDADGRRKWDGRAIVGVELPIAAALISQLK